MTRSAEQWVKDDIEAMNSKDIDQIVSVASDDCIWENVATKEVCKGKEELRKYFKDLFTAFPDMNVELKSWFASGNQVCVESIMSGTSIGKMPNSPIEPTGKHWSVPTVSVSELKDGKAYRSKIYFDMASVMQQEGLMPGPPQ